MKRLLLILMALCMTLNANAQLRPPVQTDTLLITSIRYNYADLKQENWPCNLIFKSTTDFRIGDHVLPIVYAERCGYDCQYKANEVRFKLNDETNPDSSLSFFETDDQYIVVVSGYEFFCDKKLTSTPTYSQQANAKVNALAKLPGRNVLGSLPSPNCSTDIQGTIVVEIFVDQYGNVQKATAGAEGTTITDANLWASCRKVAMDAHFSMKADAPAVERGEIRYIFTLSRDE